MFKKAMLVAAGAASIALGSGLAVAQDEDVVGVVQGTEELGTLASALEAAGLVETLRGNGPFTIFAPSDAAFEALPEGALEELLTAGNEERLRSILTLHVSPHKAMAARLDDGMMGDTLNGGRRQVSNDGTIVKFGEATVIEPDLEASNGVVHVIDTVLIPDDAG